MEYIINIYPRATYQDKGVAEAVCKFYHSLGFDEAKVVAITKAKILELIRKEGTNNGRLRKEANESLW